MEYLITALIVILSLYIIVKRLKGQEKCAKCVENGSCSIGLRGCDINQFNIKIDEKERG